MKTIIAVALLVCLAGCTRVDSATKVLLDEGYTNITITGYRIFGCSDDDHFHTGFTATGPTGRPVAGVVCQGFFKNGTVRLD